MANLVKRFVDFQQRKICYHSQGVGDTLVLLHGFLEDMEIWSDFAPHLAQKFHVVLIDLPGHGQSEVLAEVHSMTLMSETVNQVLNHLGVRKATIIGHSMGGYVAVNFALMFAEKLSGLGFFHSHAFADSPEAKINRGRAIHVVKENHKDFISHFIPELFTEANRQKFQQEIADMQTRSKNMSKEAVVAALEGMRHRTDGAKTLANLEIPLMFIVGKEDSRTPLDKMMELITPVKEAHLLYLEGVNHMGFIEAKSQCLHFIQSFAEICNPKIGS
jgi:pimeloyl-ACP methyl ester carboxylesterase